MPFALVPCRRWDTLSLQPEPDPPTFETYERTGLRACVAGRNRDWSRAEQFFYETAAP